MHWARSRHIAFARSAWVAARRSGRRSRPRVRVDRAGFRGVALVEPAAEPGCPAGTANWQRLAFARGTRASSSRLLPPLPRWLRQSSPNSACAQWVSFLDETSTRLSAAGSLVESDVQEKDYAVADLDKDGDDDLIIVRKQPFTSTGRYPNVLLMNEDGVLVDRTGQFASNAGGTINVLDLSGSPVATLGFLDATNDRDVVVADINGDTWPDVITCITLSNGQPDVISANRVYVNQGETAGVWQGLVYDDARRIDHLTLWGDDHHRFCSVKAGDVDGDGYVDLYFGDYEQGDSEVGARPIDHNDQLLLNDGTGFFLQGSSNMTPTMLESSFGMETEIVDMNGDGKLDIVKADALDTPQAISISYNDTAVEGVFGSYQIAYQRSAYNFEIGDLNNDGRPDMIVSDDGKDLYRLQSAASVPGSPVTWESEKAFTYSGGGFDDGFGGNNIIADLDGDGWNDAIIADVDVNIAGYGRRCHIFHNLGDAPDVTLREELVVDEVVGGISTADLSCTFDVAAFDINGDGFEDMVIGTCNGTKVWINDPPIGLEFSFVGGLPSRAAPGSAPPITVEAGAIGGVNPVPGSGVVWTSLNGAPFTPLPLADSGAGRYTATLPSLPSCADELRFLRRGRR